MGWGARCPPSGPSGCHTLTHLWAEEGLGPKRFLAGVLAATGERAERVGGVGPPTPTPTPCALQMPKQSSWVVFVLAKASLKLTI